MPATLGLAYSCLVGVPEEKVPETTLRADLLGFFRGPPGLEPASSYTALPTKVLL